MWALRKRDVAGLALIGPFLLAVVVIASTALGKIQTETRKGAEQALETVLRTTHAALQIWIDQRQRDVHKLAASTQVQRLVQALLDNPRDQQSLIRHPATKALRDLLEPVLAENKDVGFFVIAPDRISIASLRDANIGTPNLMQAQRQTFLDRVFQGETSFIPTLRSDVPLPDLHGTLKSGVPCTFVASPIRGEGDQVIAILALRMNPADHFSRIAQLGHMGQTGETYAFDQAARLITESRFDQQLRSIGLIEAGGHGMLSIRITDPGGNLLEGHSLARHDDQRQLTLMAQSAISGRAGVNTEGYRDYRGVPVFGAWLWDHDLGFGLTTEIDMADALQPYYSTRRVIVAVLGIVVLLSLALSFALLWVRKRSELRLAKAYEELEQRVDERTHELQLTRDGLEQANQQLEILATTDSLTGLANRRSFTQHVENEWLRCQREVRPLSVIMLDIDYFKDYNDHYGHLAGDECLSRIAQALRSHHIATRPGDIVARYGGEEFIILLSGTPRTAATMIGEAIRRTILEENIPHVASKVDGVNCVTASVGIAATHSCKDAGPKQVIDRADHALYAAKIKGRNCSVVDESDDASV